MQAILEGIATAFSNVYSGWILWNLFLAFVPLVLSFLLFRRKAVTQPWLWWFCGFVGFIGVLPKAPQLVRGVFNLVTGAIGGETRALLALVWVATLGVITLILTFWLFKRKREFRSWLWWLAFAVFITFLPNAPYVLTDIIHLIRAISYEALSPWIIALIFIPLHLTAIVAGFEAYVISLLNQGYYLKRQGAKQYIVFAELVVHALSAIGIYLGRFIRFNSWDLVRDPGNVFVTTINSLTEKRPLAVIFITFVILTVLYWIMKQVTIGLKLRWQTAMAGDDGLD